MLLCINIISQILFCSLFNLLNIAERSKNHNYPNREVRMYLAISLKITLQELLSLYTYYFILCLNKRPHPYFRKVWKEIMIALEFSLNLHSSLSQSYLMFTVGVQHLLNFVSIQKCLVVPLLTPALKYILFVDCFSRRNHLVILTKDPLELFHILPRSLHIYFDIYSFLYNAYFCNYVNHCIKNECGWYPETSAFLYFYFQKQNNSFRLSIVNF